MNFSASEVATYFRAKIPSIPQTSNDQWRGPCPIHRGEDNNFAVEAVTGRWYCFSQCGKGDDLIALEIALTGAEFRMAKAEVLRVVGRDDDLPKQMTHYVYTDANGRAIYRVVRTASKGFYQQRFEAGKWIKGLKGVPPVPYQLPEVLNAETVYIVEGEKDVETLRSWGLVATCNSGGAGNWKSQLAPHFKGRNVVILPDNDAPGCKHAWQVAAELINGAKSVRIVDLPDLPLHGDVSDWAATGGTREALVALVSAAPPQSADSLGAPQKREDMTDPDPPQAQHAAGTVSTRRLADIEAKPVSWLWHGRIARGKLTIIAGNPGLGKSQITASIAAVVATGGCWPVDGQQCTPGDVIFLSAEDDPADTLRPRLEAAGAILTRVHFVDGVSAGYAGDGTRKDRTFSLQADLEALSLKLRELGNVALVVIDPMSAYLGDTDSHKNADVRALLAPLSELAARHNVAIIGVSHLSKAAGPPVLMRVSGSLAFVAAARAAYIVASDKTDAARRFFLPMKNNIGPDGTGLAFRIESATVQSACGPLATSRVSWESEPVTMTADEVVNADSASKGTSALEEATEWLRDALSDGPIPGAQVHARAKADGIAEITLRRASHLIGVKKDKVGMASGWLWSLPKAINSAEDAHVSGMSIFGKIDHLRESQAGDATQVEIEL